MDGTDRMTIHGAYSKRRNARLAEVGTASAALTLAFSALAGSASAEGLLIGVLFPSQNQVRWAWEQRFFEEQAKANGDEAIFSSRRRAWRPEDPGRELHPTGHRCAGHGRYRRECG